MSRSSQRGIALVITLIMLAVVTVMAVVFLGISRRERTSVAATADLTDAKLMADDGLARAQAQIIARIAAHTNLNAYDLLVSTNFIQRSGFRQGVSGLASLTNVSYVGANLLPLVNLNDIRQNQLNLFYDPRPPVFIVTNTTTGQSEFRFYIDLNRNGRFDDTDYEPWKRGPLGTNSVGDPQWIGVLEHPDMPHSPSNRFIGRYAFVVLPAGKMLDINYAFNSVKSAGTQPQLTGYRRNEGVGPWELNLAAFLYDLNTNVWRANYAYDPLSGNISGAAFANALSILNYRYSTNLLTLRSVDQLFGARGATVFRTDQIDGYSDDVPPMTGTRLPGENLGLPTPDNPNLPWPGSDNTNGYFSIQELFDPAKSSQDFLNRLRNAIADTTRPYNFNTFARLMGQLGTDSLPANRKKLNLNYVNVDPAGAIVPQLATNFVAWAPIQFFTSAGNLLLQRQFGGDVAINRIPLWPTNYYAASVHRMLQLAANICDAMTNRVVLATASSNNLYLPTVFRPLIGRQSTNIFIVGFQEVTNLVPLSERWIDLNLLTDRNAILEGQTNFVNVYNLPWVIGAKKGFPNFNEYYLQTSVQVTRRIQAEKTSVNALPTFRPAYELGISNYFGAEAWNSYLQAYPRQLEMRLTNSASIRLNLGTNPASPPLLAPYQVSTGFVFTINPPNWAGEQFRTPLTNRVVYLPNSEFHFNTLKFSPPTATNVTFERLRGDPYPIPDWKLYVTNRFQFILIDAETRRIVDFVNLDNLIGSMDITKHLFGSTNLFQSSSNRAGSFWSTNRIGFQMPAGISNQVLASITNLLSASEWSSLSLNPVTGEQKEKAIDAFRQFLNMTPLFNSTSGVPRVGLHMVPFTPTRKLDLQMSWQANDPLVHYHIEDLYDRMQADTNNVAVLRPGDPPAESNLGRMNLRYRPWGGRPGSSVLDLDPAMQDPLVRRSDDWDFPTNVFPNIGWLGRVHRGTPWQTVYLKSGVADLNKWRNERGRSDTHPTNDWWILDLFTTALNDNAARGLLSVNQTNLASWSAVLSGVAVLTNSFPANQRGGAQVYSNLFIQPGSPQLLTIVSNINFARLQQPNQTFLRLGNVLASPALTLASPFLNTADPIQVRAGINDAAYERIPQQILSLLKEDEPYVVIYSFGQSLKPADHSIVTAPGPYQNLCTNYQVTGEVATKAVVRFEETFRQQGKPSVYRAVVESYNSLPSD